MEIFGKRLKEVRREKKITQSELGKAIGVSKPEICFYENGFRNPSLSNLVEIADFLNVDVAWLLGREVRVDKNNEVICLSEKEIEMLNLLRKNRKLYSKLLSDPEKILNQMSKEINK